MWYLNVSMLLSIIGLVIILGIVQKTIRRLSVNFRTGILIAFSFLFLFNFSKKLLVFYLVYTAINFAFCKLIEIKKVKKAAFYLGILFSVLIFLAVRLIDIKAVVPPTVFAITLVGLAYNMLKAIDALFLAYFADIKIKLFEYFSYMFFIPTFTSGPIIRYIDFSKNLNNPIPVDIEAGVKRVITGLFKKVVLVQPLTILYNFLIDGNLDFAKSSFVLLVYYILLFFDFSGYSDIAIGFGSMMGFKIPENFKKPFSSPTMTQFWRNWHSSLGDWFRDHIFVFLIRKSKNRFFVGIMALSIMLLIGLWHGFGLLFILWGIYHGTLSFMENVFGLSTVNRKKNSTLSFYTRCAIVNILVAFGTIFFSSNIQTAAKILKGFLCWKL